MKNNNTCTALALPEKVSKRIQPPMTKAQIISGMVEVQYQAYVAGVEELKREMDTKQEEADKRVARCIAVIPEADWLQHVSAPSVWNGNQIQSTTVSLPADVLDKATKDAVLALSKMEGKVNDYRSRYGLNSRWDKSPEEVRAVFREKIVATMKSQAAQADAERIQSLMKKPTIKQAFTDMLDQLQGKQITETIPA